MKKSIPRDLTHDLVLPTLLFAALGAMTWAVRGCSGYGALAGCMFAGVGWGAAWWYVSRTPGGVQARRYTSGWIIPALTIGIGVSGARGWAQWPNFFEGRLLTNAAEGAFVPISTAYGFLWLFIAGVPWAGIGACMLAWCGPERPLRARDWALRIACGVAGVLLAGFLFDRLPHLFLPLYDTLRDNYQDFTANPSLKRLVGDCRLAVVHLGCYLGFLAFEAARRDRKNVTLILTVGLINGAGWALLQNWTWAQGLFGAGFNWWRCWESSGGVSIGVALGVAYYLVNRPLSTVERARRWNELSNPRPNLERFGAWFGLLLGLGLSARNGLKGWANIYLGNEDYWSAELWRWFGPGLLLGLAAILVAVRLRPRRPGVLEDLFPRAHRLMWLTLVVLNVLAQLVTGPKSNASELAFSLYYLLLFAVTAAVTLHYQRRRRAPGPASPRAA